MTQRLDVALVTRGLARSRAQAADLIARGRVRVDGRRASRASEKVSDRTRIEADADPYVSRAAHMLLGALDATGTVAQVWRKVKVPGHVDAVLDAVKAL